jgi:hypothetical protein
MRFVVSTVLAGALLLVSGYTHAQVTKDVSEVTGVTRIESESMRSLYDEQYAGDHASFRAEYVHDPDEGAAWVLSFYGFTEDTTQVSRVNEFVVRADGASLRPLRLESKTRRLDDALLEIKRAAFTRADFERIATAQTVSVTMGAVSFRMTRPLRKDLRLILDRVPEGEGPQTASTTVDSSSNNQ